MVQTYNKQIRSDITQLIYESSLYRVHLCSSIIAKKKKKERKTHYKTRKKTSQWKQSFAISLDTLYKSLSHHPLPPPSQPMTDSDIALWKPIRGRKLNSYDVMAACNGNLLFFFKKKYIYTSKKHIKVTLQLCHACCSCRGAQR